MKKNFYELSMNDGTGTLVLPPDDMKDQDWHWMADNIRHIRVIQRTQKWYDSLGEWEG